ncbi:MAG: DEAD/DEAH box helicase [Bacteroidaceae bacterium]
MHIEANNMENEDYIFNQCQKINSLLNKDEEVKARELLIMLLDFHNKNNIEYSPLVNHLIREVGLYPYMKDKSSDWQDDFIRNLFKVDVGLDSEVTLHRDQFLLLRKLVDGEDIAVSAPTSFGKSFVIDAFIKIKKPSNVMILVPTIALTDETRRRIYKKFSREYKIITTSDAALGEKNIFIFPQERALGYVEKIENLDILIVDEFYKSSKVLEPDRSNSLIKAIIKLGEKAKQRYYLAPNIQSIENNPFTNDMTFLKLDFNTVYLDIKDYYSEIQKDEKLKGDKFKELISTLEGKTLIYAGSFNNINTVAGLILTTVSEKNSQLLNDFAEWLGSNYDYNWNLTMLVKRGVGIHNGALHRSLSQIQIKLFEEEENGLNRIISTSSIIEGVNTSAENIIVWMTSGRGIRFNNFSYKNLVGRAGRMFKYFIGNIYVLAKPMKDEVMQLQIDFPEEILGDLDEKEHSRILTEEQVAKIHEYDQEMTRILGQAYNELKGESAFQLANSDFLKSVASRMKDKPDTWNGLAYLNSSEPNKWDSILYKIINLQPGNWDTNHTQFIGFIKLLSQNWVKTIPEMLEDLDAIGIGINEFFKLERNVSYKLAALLGDVNTLQKTILNNGTDISPFITKAASAFLPPVVYQLEEYGLPRMISRKLQNAGAVNFENSELTIDIALDELRQIGKDNLCRMVGSSGFELYIIDYFYDGIEA